MKRYDYTKDEVTYLRGLMEARESLLGVRVDCKNKLELVDLHLGALERCHDAWTAEAMFRRGIPMSRLDSVTLGRDHLEVYSDKLI